MKCVKGYSLRVCNSQAGYYIGTLDEEGSPMCKLSVEYYKKRDAADEALKSGSFHIRDAVEISFCGCDITVAQGSPQSLGEHL